METTVGQVIINDMLPEDMRDYNRVWDKKTKGKVLTELARRHPDQFKEVAHNLLRFGARAAYETGGQSFGAEDIVPTKVSQEFQKDMSAKMQSIMERAYKRGKTSQDPEVQQEIADAAIPWMAKIDKGIDKELGYDNPFYRQAFGTGAQKPGTLRSIVGADVFYVDQNNKRVPIPVTHGYAQGLTPAEYFIQSFGTRKGMVDLQKATQDAGFLCIAEKTQVRMADFSVKAIEDIKVGDWVLGIDNEESRIGIPVRVTATFNNGLRECYKTTFRLGAEKHSEISLVSTKEHKLLCETQKKFSLYKHKEDGTRFRTHETIYSTEVIPVGSEKKWSALPLNDVYKFDGKSEPMALLLGLLIGDGSITNTKNNRDIELTCFDPLLVDYLTDSTYLGSLDLKISVHNKEKGHYTIRDKERQTQNIKVDKNKFASVLNSNLKIRLNELGLLGTNSKTKFIPEEVYTWDKQSIANLIGGYFITDGSIHLNTEDRQQPMITFGSVSKRLLEQVKELLERRFGILCHSVYTSDRNHRLNPNQSTAYYLAISRRQDVQKFCKEIPVVGIKKQRIEELKDKFSNKGRDKRRYYKVSQELVGDLQTYDIEVDSPNHLFVLANGLIVSNSKQLVQIAHRLVVTDKDDPDPNGFDPNMPVGYPVDTDDPDNEGAYLAVPVGGYPRNTLLTPKILGELKSKGIDNIIIRSVMVGGPANGGVYAYDCGIREKGRLPSQGDFVGINAVQSISEPLTQGAISCLDPETEVRMGNASVKKLKDIKVGDTVLGASKEGKAFPVKVTNIFNNGIQPVYSTTFRQPDYPWKKVTIKATMEHKILQVKDMENPEPRIAPIGIGAKNPAAIIHQFGGENLKFARYESHFVGDIETLDIEVDCEDHLFVLANGMIVSNSKHSGGVAGADSGKAISGFKYINQLIQVPKHFQGGATHAETDGIVGKIEDAPQGGKYLYINGIQHYIGRTQDGDIPILVKKGDRVEAGDVLTEGIPNPAMIVKYKGIGEGRRYFTNMFRNALNNAGTPVHRRNIEALSRGLINYVRLNEEVGDYAPDDVIPYSMIEKDYKPRKDAVVGNPNNLEECYLERPVLHYSIGTQLRPSVIKELQKYGIKQVCAHRDPPPFESEMIRGMAHVSYDPDWATRLLGAYNKDSLLEGARRGATSSAESTSYVPAITFGEGDFGHIGPLKQAGVWGEIIKQADMVGGADPFELNDNRDNTSSSGFNFTTPKVNPLSNTFFQSPYGADAYKPPVYEAPRLRTDMITTRPPQAYYQTVADDFFTRYNYNNNIPYKQDSYTPTKVQKIYASSSNDLYWAALNQQSGGNLLQHDLRDARLATRNYDISRQLLSSILVNRGDITYMRNLPHRFEWSAYHLAKQPYISTNRTGMAVPIHEIMHAFTVPEEGFESSILAEGLADSNFLKNLNKLYLSYPSLKKYDTLLKADRYGSLLTHYNAPQGTVKPEHYIIPKEQIQEFFNSPEFIAFAKEIGVESPRMDGNCFDWKWNFEHNPKVMELYNQLLADAESITGRKFDNSLSWVNNPKYNEVHPSTDFLQESFKYTDPGHRAVMQEHWKNNKVEIPGLFENGEFTVPYQELHANDPTMEVAHTDTFQPRTNEIRNPFSVTTEDVKNLPKVTAREPMLSRAGRFVEKVFAPAVAYAGGLKDTNRISQNINNWVYNQAKANGVSENDALGAAGMAQGFAYPWVATGSAINQAPRVAADFTVAAPTDLVNLGIAGLNGLGLTNSEYLTRPNTEGLTIANAVQHPVQFGKDVANATFTGIDNINPGRFDVQGDKREYYPEGIDPVNEEDMALFKQMSEMQAQGLNHGKDYMYMPENERTQLYYQYEGERQQYEEIVNKEKATIAEAIKQGRSGVDTVKQWLERDQQILNQINMEMYALKKVSPALQQQLWLLEGNVPSDERQSYKKPVYNPAGSGYTDEQIRDLLTPIE